MPSFVARNALDRPRLLFRIARIVGVDDEVCVEEDLLHRVVPASMDFLAVEVKIRVGAPGILPRQPLKLLGGLRPAQPSGNPLQVIADQLVERRVTGMGIGPGLGDQCLIGG